MATTKVSSKYQIVIPRDVREQMDLHEGQTVYVERINDNELRLSTKSVVERFAGRFGDLWGADPMETLKRERAESDRFE
jgi:AbrB family looped-hinge helix DNA binding protein